MAEKTLEEMVQELGHRVPRWERDYGSMSTCWVSWVGNRNITAEAATFDEAVSLVYQEREQEQREAIALAGAIGYGADSDYYHVSISPSQLSRLLATIEMFLNSRFLRWWFALSEYAIRDYNAVKRRLELAVHPKVYKDLVEAHFLRRLETQLAEEAAKLRAKALLGKP